ncbi:MAG: carbamoyltransferase HypF [Friedmanniella sp.]
MTETRDRQRLTVDGVVQGVGFRPFVYALARELGLSGAVANSSAGVVIEVEGPQAALQRFQECLWTNAPPLAQVHNVAVEQAAPRGGTAFVIEASRLEGGRTFVSPDVATCADCLAELADPTDRRYRHPFISCTNCGPRFSIIAGLPYDRPTTTMAPLPLCAACAAQYADPADRRFHAQTVACPECGPQLLLHRPGEPDVRGEAALTETRRLLSGGAVVAVKGLGGYHLACDAADSAAVRDLRKRKDRGDKPFAVMVRDLTVARGLVDASEAEEALLTDPRRPVVLLARRPDPELRLADDVAPDSADLGVLLPYTPVHVLLFGLVGDPPGPQALVMTSGNLSGEPIVTDDAEARRRLAPLADAWLSHDRRIQVPCDDSVVRVTAGGELPVRRSRGYAPLPIALPLSARPALAVGSDLKNTFGIAEGRYAWLSAHVGDMDDLATLDAFASATGHLTALTGVQPEVLVADRHPGFRSTGWAERHRGHRPLRKVQHHHAHIASALAENGYSGDEPVIGFAFDGTGYGDDGAVWGGELLVADYTGYERVGHLRYALLPGGDAGVRNPCRMSLSHLHAAGLAWDPDLPCVAACSAAERAVLGRQLETGLNTVPTSSMGRLFDAFSSLAGVCHRAAYEAEAAMRFEGLARGALAAAGHPYRFTVEESDGLLADPSPVLAAAAADVQAGTRPALVAARFHLAVADLVAELAVRTRARTGHQTVALSGGVFLNALLTDLCVDRLHARGFDVLTHHRVPPSDAGLALGQLVVGARIPSPSDPEQRRTTCA